MILAECDIEIDFTDAIGGLVFDQMDSSLPDCHGVGEMHRVDFVVEFIDAIIFVEIKDPSHPKAQQKQIDKFYNQVSDGSLSTTFVSKFTDTFLYRWAEDKLNKPIHYINLITLEAPLLSFLSEDLTKKMPPIGKRTTRWQRPIFGNCQIFNIETWNDNFPKWPVTRISAPAQAASIPQGI